LKEEIQGFAAHFHFIGGFAKSIGCYIFRKVGCFDAVRIRYNRFDRMLRARDGY
jgi:hypothetical protein